MSEVKNIRVGNVDMAVTTLTDEEVAQRRWNAFEDKYTEDRRIMVNIRERKLNAKVSFRIVGILGNFMQGNWDIYCPDGERTVEYYLKQRDADESIIPVTYIIGVSDKVSEEDFQKLKKSINRLKLTTKN